MGIHMKSAKKYFLYIYIYIYIYASKVSFHMSLVLCLCPSTAVIDQLFFAWESAVLPQAYCYLSRSERVNSSLRSPLHSPSRFPLIGNAEHDFTFPEFSRSHHSTTICTYLNDTFLVKDSEAQMLLVLYSYNSAKYSDYYKEESGYHDLNINLYSCFQGLVQKPTIVINEAVFLALGVFATSLSFIPSLFTTDDVASDGMVSEEAHIDLVLAIIKNKPFVNGESKDILLSQVFEALVLTHSLVFSITCAVQGNNRYDSYHILLAEVVRYEYLIPLIVIQVMWLAMNVVALLAIKCIIPYLMLPYLTVSVLSFFITSLLLGITIISRCLSVDRVIRSSEWAWPITLLLFLLSFFALMELYFTSLKLACFRLLVKRKKAVQGTSEKPAVADFDPFDSFSRRSTVIISDDFLESPPRF
uniref:Transmembrane protein n=1 Tax=Heterorhabditis bacteriophora TaxID=37862 RepID=A0A1I7XEZ0_HETBA